MPYCTEDGEVLKFQGKTGLKAYYEANSSELDKLQELVNNAGRDDEIQVVGAPGTVEDGY